MNSCSDAIGRVVLVLACTFGFGAWHMPAQAHSVTLDGSLADWCYPALPAGLPDSFRRLGAVDCPAGFELVWYDGAGDQIGTNDVAVVGMTTDAQKLYFSGRLNNILSLGAIPHFQVAIDVVSPAGNTTWWDPLNVLTNRLIGQNTNPLIRADYLIIVDTGLAYLGQNGAAAFESFTTPGTWTVINPQYTIGFTLATSTLEIGVPWSAFACPSCPPIGPNSVLRYTFMMARGNLSAPYFTPKGPIDDITSEQVAGTYTTTPQSCVPGAVKTTTCELSNGSSDAFLTTGAPSGSVPDGRFVTGTPLTASRGPGAQVTLNWGASCVGSDVDYEVYEGSMANFSVHGLVLCSTAGTRTAAITPAAGNRYFLVVPTNASFEGSYGKDRSGIERPVGSSACRPRLIGGCPP